MDAGRVAVQGGGEVSGLRLVATLHVRRPGAAPRRRGTQPGRREARILLRHRAGEYVVAFDQNCQLPGTLLSAYLQ